MNLREWVMSSIGQRDAKIKNYIIVLKLQKLKHTLKESIFGAGSDMYLSEGIKINLVQVEIKHF